MMNSFSGRSFQPNEKLNSSEITSTLHSEITPTSFCISPRKYIKVSDLVKPKCSIGPRRYDLSSNGTKDLPRHLLTSSSYNNNFSTYIDSKSPGNTRRFIHYEKKSTGKQKLTHLKKYGCPKLFSSIHLFKEDATNIAPKPTKPKVLTRTPDIKFQCPQDHNRLLLEGIVGTNFVVKKNSRSGNELTHRCVIDVLKKLPRKRIHSAKENERDDGNKKLRKGSLNGNVDCSERNEEADFPTSDASTSQVAKPAMKKLCIIDAVFASNTSSMYASHAIGNKRKIVGERKPMVSPIEKKKINDANTLNASPLNANTVYKEIDEEPLKQNEPVDKQTQCDIDVEKIIDPLEQALKIFDDKPLEIIRKNRLGALLSVLTGRDIPSMPMEYRRKALDQDWLPQKPPTRFGFNLTMDKPLKNSDISEK